MYIWRITRELHSALDGEGARIHGSRWNSEGVAVVHAAEHLSLSALEYLVHIDVEDVPGDLLALRIEVPENATDVVLEPEDLPSGWWMTPSPASCVRVGDEWVARGETLLLRVPSVLVPEERNVLVNPAHPRARQLRVARSRPFRYDPRLIGRVEGRGG